MEIVFGDAKRTGRLDYVSAWYMKAAQYMNNSIQNQVPKTKTAFVSTNSINQGEQVNILWKQLFNEYSIKIHFAHRTFKWSNEAKGNAAVHVVIIGFANYDSDSKQIFDYPDPKGDPESIPVKNINAYLTNGKNIFIESRAKPVHTFPEMIKGSQPTDGGHLVLTIEERQELLHKEPDAAKWIKPYIGSHEFINNKQRFCLWLKDIQPSELRRMPEIINRINKVKESRLGSPTPSVKEYAKHPHLFTQDRQPRTNYLVVPEVSSINRPYIPIGFLTADVICSNKLQIISNASPYLYGILQSSMHMTWTRYVCGRMKSDYSYSPQVYHNFPFPENPTERNKQAIELAAQQILETRLKFADSNLADLYDPLTMPPALVKAHDKLDKAVDLCYRQQPFTSEPKRIEFLFELYEKYTSGLFGKEKK